MFKKILIANRGEILNPMESVDAVEFLIDKMKTTKTNDDFFQSMNQ